MKLPIYTGTQGSCHIQGIAVDAEKGYIYYSFTTKLIKATLDGEIVGSADGLTGHLGCIDFNETDGRVYGSLEYKNDSIGRGIKRNLGGVEGANADGFYIAVFDVDKIDRPDMDAAKDGIMTAVYLKEVVDDYNGTGVNKNGEAVSHRYGCSGIDGTAFGIKPGSGDGRQYLFVCYGIYEDNTRADNDYQVILCYDTANWARYEKPLNENSLHTSGPERPYKKFFLYTGNTCYGVQNLEYDAFTNSYFAAVYNGSKPEFPNYSLFAIDAAKAPFEAELKGLNEKGECLTLKHIGRNFGDIWGIHGEIGTTGLYAFGDGRYLISQPQKKPDGQCSYIYLYEFNDEKGFTQINTAEKKL